MPFVIGPDHTELLRCTEQALCGLRWLCVIYDYVACRRVGEEEKKRKVASLNKRNVAACLIKPRFAFFFFLFVFILRRIGKTNFKSFAVTSATPPRSVSVRLRRAPFQNNFGLRQSASHVLLGHPNVVCFMLTIWYMSYLAISTSSVFFHANYLGTDFTVLVQNVPPRVTELEISNHFSTILGSDVVEVYT